ncbi:uncharacterized protein BcabD6B2_16650 [Babesia caballi]|uniref:Uncharacterized protein n=1 Tax=Babesia caballi TaxID=5871 RepID=A0AAV4LQT4_BABCB|nr:hypothetical protein BcabD6B2_16650 [Babesia caballi]
MYLPGRLDEVWPHEQGVAGGRYAHDDRVGKDEQRRQRNGAGFALPERCREVTVWRGEPTVGLHGEGAVDQLHGTAQQVGVLGAHQRRVDVEEVVLAQGEAEKRVEPAQQVQEGTHAEEEEEVVPRRAHGVLRDEGQDVQSRDELGEGEQDVREGDERDEDLERDVDGAEEGADQAPADEVHEAGGQNQKGDHLQGEGELGEGDPGEALEVEEAEVGGELLVVEAVEHDDDGHLDDPDDNVRKRDHGVLPERELQRAVEEVGELALAPDADAQQDLLEEALEADDGDGEPLGDRDAGDAVAGRRAPREGDAEAVGDAVRALPEACGGLSDSVVELPSVDVEGVGPEGGVADADGAVADAGGLDHDEAEVLQQKGAEDQVLGQHQPRGEAEDAEGDVDEEDPHDGGVLARVVNVAGAVEAVAVEARGVARLGGLAHAREAVGVQEDAGGHHHAAEGLHDVVLVGEGDGDGEVDVAHVDEVQEVEGDVDDHVGVHESLGGDAVQAAVQVGARAEGHHDVQGGGQQQQEENLGGCAAGDSHDEALFGDELGEDDVVEHQHLHGHQSAVDDPAVSALDSDHLGHRVEGPVAEAHHVEDRQVEAPGLAGVHVVHQAHLLEGQHQQAEHVRDGPPWEQFFALRRRHVGPPGQGVRNARASGKLGVWPMTLGLGMQFPGEGRGAVGLAVAGALSRSV